MKFQKGHTFTQMVKDKISATLKKRFKDKTKHPSFGVKPSLETKEKQRKAKEGIYLGKNNPNYKGGISKSEYVRKVRKAAIEILGGKCIRCGFNDIRALQIDHIHAGGANERRDRKLKSGSTFHNHVLRSFLNKENKYQLLCANCNWIKRVENNEHKKLSTVCDNQKVLS